ncbi:MAG: RnfABCDGE type electron transport complex subunit G [Thermoplasmata archaeon]|nr:RnfABCDGE type electron transport complex subunit G [Thermoplasmata archaeon]
MMRTKGIDMKEMFPVFRLTIVVAVAVIALTITDAVTRDLIAESREKELQALLEKIFPGMDDYEEKDDVYFILERSDVPVENPYGIDENYEIIGFAFIAEGDGYGGAIELLIGIEPDLDDPTLVGIRVLTQSETPGLGAKIADEEFTDQFNGLATGDAVLTDDGGQIDAISGATISSRAVVDAIQDAVSATVDDLKAMQEVT